MLQQQQLHVHVYYILQGAFFLTEIILVLLKEVYFSELSIIMYT